MVLTEYNQEQHLAMERKQEYEAGLREGHIEGRIEGRAEGWKQGLEALVISLKSILPDYDSVAQKIREQKQYADVTDEQIHAFYD